MYMKQKNVKRLLISLVIPQVASGLGLLASFYGKNGWDAALEKPLFNPPDWVFGPVWNVLFILMGVALYIVWRDGKGEHRNLAFTFFGIQLGLNVMWSMLFFGLHEPAWAFIEILFLCCAIIATLSSFWRINKNAGALLVPYLAWILFAGILNIFIWQLN